MIGMFLLVGLVSKNSILLVNLINRYRQQGIACHASIALACPQRMRPVLMTSLTIVLARMPAAIGIGEGSGQYGPLSVAVIGGVISSTLLTLVVVPVAYSLLDPWLGFDKADNISAANRLSSAGGTPALPLE
jgi:HAE1 family hydrophobic/amphiphilic exporter-1